MFTLVTIAFFCNIHEEEPTICILQTYIQNNLTDLIPYSSAVVLAWRTLNQSDFFNIAGALVNLIYQVVG